MKTLCVWFRLGLLALLLAPSVRAQVDERLEKLSAFNDPVYWIGDTPPSEQETAELVQVLSGHRLAGGRERTESFLAAHLDSPWAASLAANLAWQYRQQGLYTRALDLWENVWEVTKDDESPGGTKVREFVVAKWVRLLSTLGRKDRLVQLGKEWGQRPFADRTYQIAFNQGLEVASAMENRPQIAFRCGPLAMWNVAQVLGKKEGDGFRQRASEEQGKWPYSVGDLRRWESPTNGFSTEQLVEAAEKLGLDWVAARRPVGGSLVSPSVIHWKQDHYAAIVGHTNGYCILKDPTFGETEHPVPDEVVEEEASGVFLVPREKLPPDWVLLEKAEVREVRGRGLHCNIDSTTETKNETCSTCHGMPVWWISEPYLNQWLSDTPVGWKTTEGQEMAFTVNYKQRESRPYPVYNRTTSDLKPMSWNHNWLSWIELEDAGPYTPIFAYYSGMPVLFVEPSTTVSCGGGSCPSTAPPSTPGGIHITGPYYCTGGSPVPTNQITSLSKVIYGSDCAPNPLPTLSYPCYSIASGPAIIGDPPDLFSNPTLATVNFSEGGQLAFNSFTTNTGTGTKISVVDPKSKVQLVITNSGALPNRITGATLLNPDGSQDRYTLVIRENGQTVANGYRAMLYRTAHLDPAGRQTTFAFDQANPSTNPLVRLAQVTDSDGHSATLTYGSSVPNLVTQVTDPYSRTATLAYDSSGLLTNIVDAVGMSSSFTYDSMGAKTLTTPYGTSTFTLYEESGSDGGNVAGVNRINRAALIMEPEGAKQLYIYASRLNRFGSDVIQMMPESTDGGFGSDVRPELPFSGTTFDVGDSYSDLGHDTYGGAVAHNSFHWGRKQAAGLSTTNFLDLAASDIRLCRLKHWLNEPDEINVTSTLSHEIAPSSNGVNAGGITWYDYPGKDTNHTSSIGTSLQPSIIAQRMPGGPTWWVQLQYNTLGLVTNVASSYTKLDGTTGTRTNTVSYVNNVYPSLITKTDGSRDWGIAYNANNQIQYVTNALGDVTGASYDSGTHKLTNIAFPNGLNLQLSWNPGAGGTLNQVSAAGYSTSIFTWSNGQIQTLTDPLGLVRTFTFDGLDRLIKVAYPDSTYETNRYSRLDLVGTVDRLGATNLFGYNGLGQMTSATNALGAVTYLNRCVCGLLDSIVTPLGQTYGFLYDNAGQLVQKNPPASSPVWLQYDHYGRLTNSYDTASSFSLSYNNQGRATNVWNALGNLWTGVYDVEDRLIRSTNRNGIGSTNTFDALNRVLTTTWPDGGIEKVFYGPGMQVVTAYTNQIGKVQLMGFDGLQRLLTQAVPGVFTNTFAYNGASLITNLVDGNGHQTAWIYDSYGRAIQKKDNSGNLVWTNGYNANGWLTKRYTPAKGLATFSYNALGKLTNAAFPTSTAQSYVYDAQSRLISMTDAVGTSGFTYNAFGALNSEDGPWSNDTLNYTYTLTRLRSGLVLQQPSGIWAQNYQYDAANRLTNTASGAGSFVYDYLTSSGNNPSLVSKVTMPSGGYIQSGFDSVGRLQSTALKNTGGTTMDSQTYVFDQAGQRTKTTSTAGNYWDYTYDNSGELLTAKGKESGGTGRLQEQLSYGYDNGGNLLYRTNYQLIQALSVDGQNQLTSVASSGTLTVSGKVSSSASSVAVNGAGGTVQSDNSFTKSAQSFTTGFNTYTAVATQTGTGTTATASSTINIPPSSPFGYDLNGNLVSDGQRQFDYDDQDQLTRVTVGIASRSEFTYDGLSRKRIAKEYSASVNSTAALISVSALAPTTRNNYSGWVGSQVAVQTRAVLVSDLGRWVKSGNTQTHTVKLVVASTGADVPGASVTIATSGATAGQFAYGTLPVPVMLNPNTTYYLVSQEVNGGDSWYEYTNTLSAASGLTIPGVVMGTGGSYTATTAANQGYGPVGFKGVVATAMLSATSLSSTLRSNVDGWVGCRITVGTDPLAVTELARWVAPSNGLTHTVKLVRAVDGVDVAGARVTVDHSGVSSGHLQFATLPSPVVLEANTTYYLVSQETIGGDQRYDSNTTAVSASSGVTVPGAILYSGGSWMTSGSANSTYGPVSFKAVPVTWNTAKETRYVYDGMLAIQERNGSNTPQVSYTRGKDLSGGLQGAGGIGGILAQTTSANVSQYYHADGLGNVTALLNVNNQLSATYNYDPYGNLLGSSGPMADLNPYRFSSKEFHRPSGTYAFGFRHYDPNLQRWLNRDPMGERGGINLFEMVASNPMRYGDPFGLSWWDLLDLDGSTEYFWAYANGFGNELIDSIVSNANLLHPLLHQWNDFLGEQASDAYNAFNNKVFGCRIVCRNYSNSKTGKIAGAGIVILLGMALGGEDGAVAKETTTVIRRVKDLKKLGPGEKSLLDRLPDRGSPKANWKQNSGVLREEMNRGLPIRDASVGDDTGIFLNAERYLLKVRGWTFDGKYWNPPVPKI